MPTFSYCLVQFRVKSSGKTFFLVLAISITVVLLFLAWACIPDRGWQHRPAAIPSFQPWMQWTIRVLLVAVFFCGDIFSSAREQPRGIDTEPIRSLAKQSSN